MSDYFERVRAEIQTVIFPSYLISAKLCALSLTVRQHCLVAGVSLLLQRKLRHGEGTQLIVAGGESAVQAVRALQSALEFCLLDQCFSAFLEASVFVAVSFV